MIRRLYTLFYDCSSSFFDFSLLLLRSVWMLFLIRRVVSLASLLCTQHCSMILDIPRNTCEGVRVEGVRGGGGGGV